MPHQTSAENRAKPAIMNGMGIDRSLIVVNRRKPAFCVIQCRIE